MLKQAILATMNLKILSLRQLMHGTGLSGQG